MGPDVWTCRKRLQRINAGVGIATHSRNLIRGDRKSDDFEKAYQLGRVDKYIIDNGGLKDNIIVFVIYGKSGGSKHARGITEAIIAAIRKEIGPHSNQPVLIMGDFNAEPNSFNQSRELIDEEAWIDVGLLHHGGEVRTTNRRVCRERRCKRPGLMEY